MWKWWERLFSREQETKLRAINTRLDRVVHDMATINNENKWMLKVERGDSLPQTFECHEVMKKDGS